ncbi:hypothetical protein P7C71_g2154, partial [Lecanoromycetidae sp. Uapishka_2]
MYPSYIFLISLVTSALAHPLVDLDVAAKLEKRDHTGWMASYPDAACHEDYLKNPDDNAHRPTLARDDNGNPILTTFDAESDNIGVYFGSGTNSFTTVDLWQGTGSTPGPDLWVSHSIHHVAGAYPGVCFPAKAAGYPWAFISIANATNVVSNKNKNHDQAK